MIGGEAKWAPLYSPEVPLLLRSGWTEPISTWRLCIGCTHPDTAPIRPRDGRVILVLLSIVGFRHGCSPLQPGQASRHETSHLCPWSHRPSFPSSFEQRSISLFLLLPSPPACKAVLLIVPFPFLSFFLYLLVYTFIPF